MNKFVNQNIKTIIPISQQLKQKKNTKKNKQKLLT